MYFHTYRMFPSHDPEGVKVLEDQAELIKQRVRDLKTLEGIGKALDKTYGKFGNTLDTAADRDWETESVSL